MNDMIYKPKMVRMGGIAKPYRGGLFIITKDCFADGDKIPDELINRVVEHEVFEWFELKK